MVTNSEERLKKAREYLRRFPDEAFWTETFAQFHRSLFLLQQPPAPQAGVSDFDSEGLWDFIKALGASGRFRSMEQLQNAYQDFQDQQSPPDRKRSSDSFDYLEPHRGHVFTLPAAPSRAYYRLVPTFDAAPAAPLSWHRLYERVHRQS